jgi:preprotein translocase SecE subunit
MARDRQRSKARQRARAAGQKPRGKRSRSRDIGLDDATVDEAGLTDDVAPPGPLEHSMPNVDEAKAAETGAVTGEPGEDMEVYEDELDRAADEVEIPPDLIASGAGGGRRGRGGLTAEDEHYHEPKDRGRVITFLRACVDELRRVQWPDRKHVFQATAVVLGFVLVAGSWLGLMDAIWQPLINALL